MRQYLIGGVIGFVLGGGIGGYVFGVGTALTELKQIIETHMKNLHAKLDKIALAVDKKV